MKHYRAPWSPSLIVTTLLATVLCAGFAIGLIASGRGGLPWAALLPLGIVGGSAPFMIRGYAVTPGAILVRRLFWTTRLPRADLMTVRFEPDAMRASIRTFGNGGLFSFTGWFHNRALGSYRAWVSDMRRTVVLRYRTRTVVVSPSTPETFVRDLESPGDAAA